MPKTTTVKETGKTTLSGIARKLGVSLSALKEANPQLERGKNFDLIYPKDTINIPEGAKPIPALAKDDKEGFWTGTEMLYDKTEIAKWKKEHPGEYDPSALEDEGAPTTPKWLSGDKYFQQLSPDEQEYMVNYYNVLALQDEENQKILAQALEDAKAQADPYFAEKIRIAQDELTRALGQQTGDFASQKRDLELRIDQIGEDLATGKERLSVDQQAELGRQQRTYEYQLENLIETARHRGLTFSTKRALAETRLKTEQGDIVESTKREFQRRITDLQTAAARGEVAAQNLLKDYERQYGESVTSLIRTAERQIGTEQLPGFPDLPGVSPLGEVIGTFAEEKELDILQRAEALANLRNPFL